MQEINRLCTITDFNDTYLLDGSRTTEINLQVGLYSAPDSIIKLDAFLFSSAMVTSLMGFQSAALNSKSTPSYIDLRTNATETDEFKYRARQIDSEGQPIKVDGEIQYLDGYYSSALAAALAENGAIEYDGTAGVYSAKVVSSSGKSNFTIEEMCAAIYRNDSSARAFIDSIDNAIDNVSLRITQIGAYMNRLDSAIDATDVQKENLVESISTLKDADVAVESSNYIKYQILQQSTATLLSTANQQPQIALNLL